MQPARIYELKQISQENVVASPNIIASETQNKYNVHHNLAYPCDAKDKGSFELKFPVLITSSIAATVGDTGYISFHIYADVYGNFHIAYQKVTSDIDKMLASLMANTTAAQYKDLLFIELEKRKIDPALIDERYKELIEVPDKEFNDELFRYIATSFLIDIELLKDKEGSAVAAAMKALKDCYCNDFDSKAKQAIKQKIYTGIGIPSKKLQKSSASLVDDIVKWQTLAKNHPTMPSMIDYSKSPQIHFKIMESIPKPETKVRSDAIILSDRGQVLWAKIYNYMDNLSGSLMKTYEEFDTLIYRKGENLSLGKTMFNLLQSMKTVAPSVYWGQDVKRGVFQFKVIEAKVFEKIERQSGSRTIPVDERERDIQEAREARERLGLNKPETLKRPHDEAATSPDYYGDDMDALIDQDAELQQEEKKRKYF